MKVSLVKRICSWCDKSMGFKAWLDLESAESPTETHGICPDCKKKLEETVLRSMA